MVSSNCQAAGHLNSWGNLGRTERDLARRADQDLPPVIASVSDIANMAARWAPPCATPGFDHRHPALAFCMMRVRSTTGVPGAAVPTAQ